MGKPELLPCPFCGCDGSLSAFQGSEDENPSAYVFCLDCGIQTRSRIHQVAAVAESLAIAEWNRRTASPAAPGVPGASVPIPPGETLRLTLPQFEALLIAGGISPEVAKSTVNRVGRAATPAHAPTHPSTPRGDE